MSHKTTQSTTRSGRVLVQMAVIIAIGFAIGLADAFVFRRVNLAARTAPPPIDGGATAGTGKPRGGTNARTANDANNPEGTPAKPEITQPDATAAVVTPGATPPGTTSFVFTPKDKLPVGHITIDDGKGLYDAAATFIDSRKAEDYAAGHIENATRMDTYMFKDGDPDKLKLITRDSNIVVYCNGGNCDESENLARLLDGSGYKKVYVLHDGFPGWKAAGHPTSTAADPLDFAP